MNPLRLGPTLRVLIVATALLGALALTGADAGAGTVVSIGRVTIDVDHQGDVDIVAEDLPTPGLGAWVIDVVYDPTVVTPLGCGEQSGSLCNLEFTPDFIRVVGANGPGVTGDAMLASLTFRCDAVGATTLTLSLFEFHDATEGDPVRIPAETTEGAVYCDDSPPPPLLGDVDCNGRVNSIDALLVLQYHAGLINTLRCIENADVNGDGRIDSRDAYLILLT